MGNCKRVVIFYSCRHRPAAVVMDGKLYVAGGYDPKEHKYETNKESLKLCTVFL